jgi:phosphatidate cytidylyltransferase
MRARVLSALVLAPAAFACLWFGSPWFELLVAAVTLAMAWEWRRICAAGAFGAAGAVSMLAVAAAIALTATGRAGAALGVVAAGAAATAALAHREPGSGWSALGAVAVGMPAVALIWLRRDDARVDLVLWLAVAVSLTDIAAFFVGRAIGGPRLAPVISPKKTWAGLLGGVVAAALWSIVFGLGIGWDGPAWLALLGAGLAVVAQLGDLSVSVVKRRFGVKDASQLIPGHGGMLDRADGYVLAAPVFALLVAFGNQGGSAPWS